MKLSLIAFMSQSWDLYLLISLVHQVHLGALWLLVDGGALWVSSLFVDKGFLLPWGAGRKSLGFVASWTELALGQDHATKRWQLVPFIETQFPHL